jgi:hypothetical protein
MPVVPGTAVMEPAAWGAVLLVYFGPEPEGYERHLKIMKGAVA